MNAGKQMSDRHDCGGDAAAYALGALEPAEAEAFSEHLRQCAICRDELEAFAGVVRALPLTARQYRAPSSLRRRLLSQVREERAATSAARAGRTARRPARGLLAGAGSLAVAAAAAVVVLQLSSGLGATVVQAQVRGVDGSAQVRVLHGRAELVVRHLSAPGSNRVYEVWLQSGTAAPRPASVLFSVGQSGDAQIGIPGNIGHVNAVLVTREPLGGTSVPTSAPVIVARLDKSND
jgi:anti-sigma-K factor RskA